MRQVKVLAIAPYEGMKTLISQAAAARSDIDVSVFVGNLEEGVAITKQYSEADFDVIISRGGTAELIRKRTSIPVVEVPLSVYDILRSMKLAENCNNKYAIIGFPAATKNAYFLCDVLQYHMDIYTIHNEKEAQESLKSLSKSGYTMVLCDMITNSLAKQYGISSILITSGKESIESALEQAVQISATYRRMKNRIIFFRALLEEHKKGIYVYTAKQELVYSFGAQAIPDVVSDKIAANIQSVLKKSKKRIYLESSRYLYTICGIKKVIAEQTYAAFFVSMRKTPFTLSKNGISSINKEEAYDDFFNSIYEIIQSSILNNITLKKYAQSSQPLMITGEVGTGKEQMAKLAYAKSQLSDNPLIIVDCSRLHERGWSFLLDNEHSPLYGSDMTIYFKGIKYLSDSQFNELVNLLKDLDVSQRSRILFSYTYCGQESCDKRCLKLINTFSCLTIMMPALRDQKASIQNLASLYISSLNLKLAKGVIGFEPEALADLEAFGWPYNFDQFKRVIGELVMVTNSSYIQLSSVTDVLRKEKKLVAPAARTGALLNLNRTLQEINLDIIKQVLAEEHDNQSATARRLGISRSTLWRILQSQ